MTPTVSSSEKRASSPNNQTIHLETFGRSPLETFQSLLTAFGDTEPGNPVVTQEGPRAFYQAAKGWLLTRGKNVNAAYFLTLERHPGSKPPFAWRDLPPIEPTAEQSRWIANRRRYQAIRRAHSPGWRTA